MHRSSLLLLLLMSLVTASVEAQDVRVVAGSNDNPNTLINASFNGSSLSFGPEVNNGGTTTGTATTLAFNQVRVFRSNIPGCTLVAQTHNNSNNVSIFAPDGAGAYVPVTGSPFALAAGVQSLAWAPDGGALYVPLAIAGASELRTLGVVCNAGNITVTPLAPVTLTGFNLMRDVEVIGGGAGSHLCVSGTNSNNIGCFAIDSGTRLPATTAVNTLTVTNVRGMRIASNGCGIAGVGTALTVQGFSVNAGGTITASNTAAPTTNPRYGAISADGTLAAFGGFGTQFSVFSVAANCNLTLVGSNNNGIATSLVEYMAFDANNRLYIADSLANQIRVFAPTSAAVGAAVATATTSHATLNAPAGIDTFVLTPAAEIAVFTGANTDPGNERADNIGTFAFPDTTVGASSAAQTFTIRNSGTLNLTGLALSKSGANNADFTLGALGSATLAPGVTTTFTVTFSPSATGARNAVVAIASNDPNENPFEINVTGNGVQIVADVQVSKTNFEDGLVVGRDTMYTIQVRNAGPASVNSVTITDDVPDASLTNAQWTCTSTPAALCPNASGTGDINQTTGVLANAALLEYTVIATPAGTVGAFISNTAAATNNDGSDNNTANNTATDTDPIVPIGIFSSGFEEPGLRLLTTPLHYSQ
jgi:uncharacterized repeat protein (TIGR01451 family)